MLLTFVGLVIFGVVFVFSVSTTKYHILCSACSFNGALKLTVAPMRIVLDVVASTTTLGGIER